MAANKRHSFLTLFLIIVLCINMLNVQTVHADGETPTEPPVATEVETEQPTEPPVDATAVPVDSTSTPVEVTPTSETIEATPALEAIAEATIPAVVGASETLENTEFVVLDEQGQALVLGSQEAANALVSSEPVWCPEHVSVPTPGANGCSISYSSIAALLVAMQTDPQSFAQNGTIYLETTTGQGFTTPFILNDSSESLGSSFNSLNSYNLTVQGGWDPTTGSTAGQTVFSGSNAYLQIGSLTNPWIGSLAINNVAVNGPGAGQDAIQIFASDVALTNVSASYSEMNGISITANEAGTVTLNNVNASNNGHIAGSEPVGSGVYINGADTLVNVTGGSFNNNARYGIEALNSASTTLPIANLWTDWHDYVPGSVVTISGNDNNLNGNNIGFLMGETVHVVVQGPNGYAATCEATANSFGAWSCQITLWSSDLAIGDYTYTATGVTSGVSVSGTFKDARSITSVTLNGGSIVTVAAGGTITIIINVTTTNPNGGANWQSTAWRFGNTGAYNCINHANHGSAGSYSETFTIQAPAAPGTYSITFYASTNNSCTTTQSSPLFTITNGITVTAADTTPPVITFVNRTPPNGNDWNNTDVTVNWSCTDALSGVVSPTVSQTVTSQGAGQSATGTCTDNAGNTASNTQGGINIDKTAPALVLPSGITSEATSSAGAEVLYTASVTDNLDAGVTVSCAPVSGDTFPMGPTMVHCFSTDLAGNTATGSFTVTVQDTAGPVIEFHADVTVEAASDQGAQVTYTPPTAADAVDGVRPVTCLPASDSVLALGDHTVTCQSTDTRNNLSTSTFVVHVVDTTGPGIAPHLDMTVEATGPTGAQVDYTAPATFDAVDGAGTATCSPVSGTTLPIGDHTITCNATDAHNNPASPATFTVHVVDTTAPIIEAHGDVTAEATSPSGAVVNYTSPSTADVVDGAGTSICLPASGTTFPVGDTTVECNAMDQHNNIAAPITFTVHVVDTTDPILTLPANITAAATGPSGAVVTFSATATDTVDTSVVVTCTPVSGSTFPLGANRVDCTATDDAGNQSTGSFFVNVQDPGAPTLHLPANMTVEATGPGGATVSFSATATDLVDGSVPVTCTPAPGSSFGFGTTTVNCSATDSNNNINTAAFLVIVQDTTAPVIAPHSDFTTETASLTGVIVNYTSPSTSDIVAGAGTASCTPVSGTLFPIGDTQVTCTATDNHGNTSTSTFLVRVQVSQPGSTGTTPAGTPATTSSGFIIPLTGGELIDLDCNRVIWAFGVKLSFLNLCDHQTTINSLGAGELPAKLPAGFSFVMGLDVDVLSAGQMLEVLPDGSGIELDFPLYNQSSDQYAVLFWSDADGKWVEVSEAIEAEKISQTLSADDGLYQVLTDSLADLYYQILTTQETGVFVLVKK